MLVHCTVGAAAERLLTQCRWQLAPFKRPRLVHFVDSRPRHALGKVLKHELMP